jgi:A/G-specific adenine glycosylase
VAPPSATQQLIARRAHFQSALHGWYRVHQRRLPWRDAPSLYKTVVSEFMLQQTQVVTVLPYFDRWLRELPDFPALAAAPEAKVMKLWEGLGYYSRARNLHKLAQALVALPAPPRTPAEWRELPGIGPYTAAAITSIAFGEPAACVDGNVVRILARLAGETKRFRDSAEAAKHFTPLADALIAGEPRRGQGAGRGKPGENRAPLPRDPGTHNQAMMELGATVCFRTKPLCLTCPVAAFCIARRDGIQETVPRFAPKKIEQREVARAFCVDRGRLLLHRAGQGARRLAGILELPELTSVQLAPDAAKLIATKRRAITRFQITESIYAVDAGAGLRARAARDPSLEWVPLAELARLTLSGPHRRWIAELLR